MAMQRVCDLCLLGGENDVPAMGWYVAADGKDYDVCSKHISDAEEIGLEMHYY